MATFRSLPTKESPPKVILVLFLLLGMLVLLMATLSLPGLNIGLPIWLFLTSMVSSVPSTVRTYPPPEQHHVDSKVDLSPSSPISSSSSSTSPGEILDSSNQVAKKNKKKTKKKKSDK